ncbi:hypothetical protein DFH07DRAFT_820661 [Mycena maculata]|uniref:Uncharacterized protein n=1 Tax=Mycena maculata TaxID=230809 RepID=A0AAD7J814_9AGAR|nr:hypothetical protein DFH07DRAFT_820661 [Mycena maculata]
MPDLLSQAAVTVTVSGTATFTADSGAITVSVGSFPSANNHTAGPEAGSTGTSSVASSTTIAGSVASATTSFSIANSGNATTSSTTTSSTAKQATTIVVTQTNAPITNDAHAGGAATSTTDVTTTAPAPATTTAILSTIPRPNTSNNLQTFTGNLGGIGAPAVVASGKQFQVENNDVFNTKEQALGRSCDVQQNACADAANASGNKGDFTVAACGTQQDACNSAAGS